MVSGAALESPTETLGGRAASPLFRARENARMWPLTAVQLTRMVAAGIVPEGAAVELLNGALVHKDRSLVGEDVMVHGPLHKLIVSLLAGLAGRINGDGCHLQIQLPLICAEDSVPEPDASIIRGTPRAYADRLPTGDDATCVVEVAHSSLLRDREDKLPIYAAAGIPQYLIINLQAHTVEEYRDPDRASEAYRERRILGPSDTVQLVVPGGAVVIQASELLP